MQPGFTHGLYDPSQEHDACGVGFVAHIKGAKTHATGVVFLGGVVQTMGKSGLHRVFLSIQAGL